MVIELTRATHSGGCDPHKDLVARRLRLCGGAFLWHAIFLALENVERRHLGVARLFESVSKLQD